jgi:hypothetical protein
MTLVADRVQPAEIQQADATWRAGPGSREAGSHQAILERKGIEPSTSALRTLRESET